MKVMFNIVLNRLTTKIGYFAVRVVGLKFLFKRTIYMGVLESHKRKKYLILFSIFIKLNSIAYLFINKVSKLYKY